MKSLKILTAAAMLLTISASAGAQALRGSYFFESSLQRTKMNPAFAPKANYINFPAIGNIGVDAVLNVGPSNILFPAGDGTLYTFANKNVSADEFLAKLPDNVFADAAVEIDLLGWGHRTRGGNGYVTVALTARTGAGITLPKEFFKMAKLGMQSDPTTYNIKGAGADADLFADFSIGYCHNFSDLLPGLSFGGRIHALGTPAGASMSIENANVTMSKEEWTVDTSIEGQITGPFTLKANEDGVVEDIELDLKSLGLAGLGAALDLGINYTFQTGMHFLSGVVLSASVADLGTVVYPKSQSLTAAGTVKYEGVRDMDIESGLDGEISSLSDQLLKMASPKLGESETSWKGRLHPKYFAGAEAQFLGNNIGLGILYSQIRNHKELTTSLNFKNLKVVNFGLNYSLLNGGRAAGFIFEFVPRGGIGFYIGTDYVAIDYAPFDYALKYVPLNKLNVNLRFGSSITFGGRRY